MQGQQQVGTPNPADGPQGAAAGERLRAAAATLARLPEPALARPLGMCAEAGALVTALPPVRCGPRTRLPRQQSLVPLQGDA